MTPNTLFKLIETRIKEKHSTLEALDITYPGVDFFETLFEDDEDVLVEHGATKVCLIPREGNFVFKINICSQYDYCSAEVDLYGSAVGHKLKDLFAKEEVYDKVLHYDLFGYDTPIYIQEKVTFSEEFRQCCGNSQSYKADITNIDKFYSSHGKEKPSRLGCGWLARCLKMYGEEIFNKLCDFIKEYNITDLHNGNVGYIKRNGKFMPILFDYSGYYEEYDSCYDSWNEEDDEEYDY